jgi:hypothetical protein
METPTDATRRNSPPADGARAEARLKRRRIARIRRREIKRAWRLVAMSKPVVAVSEAHPLSTSVTESITVTTPRTRSRQPPVTIRPTLR